MLLVHRLTRHSQRLGDLREGPAIGRGTLDGRILKAIGEAPQRADRRERIGWILRNGGRRGDYVSTIVDRTTRCQPKLTARPRAVQEPGHHDRDTMQRWIESRRQSDRRPLPRPRRRCRTVGVYDTAHRRQIGACWLLPLDHRQFDSIWSP
jgi:hypothetical protein